MCARWYQRTGTQLHLTTAKCGENKYTLPSFSLEGSVGGVAESKKVERNRFRNEVTVSRTILLQSTAAGRPRMAGIGG